ncbi:hypothetical protein Tco_1376937 [Tanacetum coccineum]
MEVPWPRHCGINGVTLSVTVFSCFVVTCDLPLLCWGGGVTLSEDFGKHFTPQHELSAKQAFWLRMSNPTSKPSDASPVKIEAPKKLPKVSLVNESLKKLKFHLARFDNVVKIRTTHDARIEGE